MSKYYIMLRHPKYAISEQDVVYIRSVYKSGSSEYGATALAKKYKVTPSCICNLIKGRSWEGV